MPKIAIIGAGPAGIYTSIFLKDFEGTIELFEQNSDIGEKLKTTGGGRMNVTNSIFSEQEFSSSSNNLLKKILKNPHVKNRENLLKELGILYKWEKNRAILQSENAIEEVARLKKKLKNQKNITLNLNTKIQKITSPKDRKFNLIMEQNQQQKNESFEGVILTHGGMYRMGDLGTKDKIYALPLNLGHTITETIKPSLCPLIFSDKALRKLSGIAFEGELRSQTSQEGICGDVLITHFGISGPAVLDFSARNKSAKIHMSFTQKISEPEFIKIFNEKRSGKNALKKFLKEFVPQRIADFLLSYAEIQENFMADLPKIKLKKLTEGLFRYPITNFQPNRYPASWTTQGGVNLTEIQTATLESKKHPHLYFAGEILDINGLCGGYNISFAAISAKIVAQSILKSVLNL